MSAGAGCGRKPLPGGSAKDADMSPERLKRASAVIREAIGRKELPGAVLLVSRRGRIVLHEAYGDKSLVSERAPMAAEAIFDLASLTKPVATATSVMILAERGELSLWDRVKMYVPGFEPYRDWLGEPADEARLWHLLTHTSGLPAYTNAEEAGRSLGNPCSTEALVGHIAALPKTAAPGAKFVYSCLGYITLAHIVGRVTGRSIAEFAADNIFKPLKMKATSYLPDPKLAGRLVPTQVIDGAPLLGVVHDPLARLQGGVSGNAGLFSSAEDLAVFAEMLLNGGEYRGVRILGPLAVERMISIYPRTAESGRGLGWDLDSAYSSNGGDIFGQQGFGHTGYTGTSLWIDPETKTTVVLLTNSVHPDDKGTVVPLRARVANAVAAAILKK
ncbi:MAG: beta-lactamase family protein [Candidatus Aminicenantes bacterium]|nr:beta-lactamase family protein [Candidatus Aminicenantes bacterium]